jgi:hypothetical protein
MLNEAVEGCQGNGPSKPARKVSILPARFAAGGSHVPLVPP